MSSASPSRMSIRFDRPAAFTLARDSVTRSASMSMPTPLRAPALYGRDRDARIAATGLVHDVGGADPGQLDHLRRRYRAASERR